MKKRWKFRSLLACVFFVLFVTGCGRQAEQISEMDKPIAREVDWKQGFVTGEIKQVQEWNTCDFQKIQKTYSNEGKYKGGQALTNTQKEFIELAVYAVEDGKNYYIKRISPEGVELEDIYIDQSEWATEEKTIFSYDVMGERMYFGICERGNAESAFTLPEHVYIVSTDRAGKQQSMIDLSAGLASLGCNDVPSDFFVDGEGYIYVQVQDAVQRSVLYVTDSEGKGVLVYQCDTPMKDVIYKPVRDNRGQIFFPVYELDEKTTILLWKDGTEQWKELARLEGIVSNWFGMENNFVYYQEGEELVCWDVLTGKAEKLLHLRENGIDVSEQALIALNEEGEIYLRYRSQAKDWVVRVTTDALPQVEALVFGTVQADMVATTVKSAVVTYSRESSVPVEIQDDSDKEEESRLLIDMVNGKGPDIMYVSYQDMVNLHKKDALLDIGDMIPEVTKETFLPQVLELGTLDGALYGIPICMNLHTVFASNELWSADSWNMEDVLELIEDHPGLECMFTERYAYEDMFEYLFMYDLKQGKSRFIDWEKGISRFEEMDFMGALERLMAYVSQGYFDTSQALEDGVDRIAAKTALGYVQTACDPIAFNLLMNQLGGNCHAVGIPSEDGLGNYLEAEGLLVVNTNVSEEKKELISGFLQYMVGEEVQKNISSWSLSIIDGLVYENIQYHADADAYYFQIDNSMFLMLYAEEDGNTYMEEYKELLASAIPLTGNTDIVNIVIEELRPFFVGERTALEVTRNIDNRVQLYLDENK